MTRDELLEHAMFEMLGVLDEVELARFERALAASASSVQSEVSALQARMAIDPLFRDASEQPSSALRLRTMARLLEEMESDAVAAAPIATIGPRMSAFARPDRVAADAGDAITAESMRRILAEVAARSAIVKPQRQLFWRVASFFLLAALLVALYFNQQLSRTALQLAAGVNERALSAESLDAAAEVAGFDLSRASRVQLACVGGSTDALVQAFVQRAARAGAIGANAAGAAGGPATERGHVLVQGLGVGRAAAVRVVVKDRDGIVLGTRQVKATEAGLFSTYLSLEGLSQVGTIEVELEDGAMLRASYTA
jgi:hypothetical protein